MKEKRKVKLVAGNGTPLRARKTNAGRNAFCVCGSGKKAKRCCGENAEYFHTALPKTNETKK